MVILEDSTIDSVVVVWDLRWLLLGRVVVGVIGGDSGWDCIAVKKAVVWEEWRVDGTPNAFALGKALCNAITAKRADAIIVMVSIL